MANPNYFEFSDVSAEYVKSVSSALKSKYVTTPKAYVRTYGCQQNISDSERIKGILTICGYTVTENCDEADFILFNTCAVRGHAEDRVFGNIGVLKKLKEKNPNLIIAIAGCMTQNAEVLNRLKRSFRYVNIAIGTGQSHRLPEYIYKAICGEHIYCNELDNKSLCENIPVQRDNNIHGWLPVMYGCNNFCTYCIVPYARGRERSRRPHDIIAEAEQIIKSGVKEITLLGQNVNSYGIGCDFNTSFADILQAINNIDGDFRIKFMTSHPKDCTEDLLNAVTQCDKVAKHIHLPFQSGSDRILSQMNRRYDREKYLSLIKSAREKYPDIAITSDIIVGFPGETYEDFLQTLSLVKQVKFTSLFTFIYSPRPGTPAARMDDPVSRAEKGKWFDELLDLQERIGRENLKNMVGKCHRVLIGERPADDKYIIGSTDGNIAVYMPYTPGMENTLCNIRITEYNNNNLYGEII